MNERKCTVTVEIDMDVFTDPPKNKKLCKDASQNIQDIMIVHKGKAYRTPFKKVKGQNDVLTVELDTTLTPIIDLMDNNDLDRIGVKESDSDFPKIEAILVKLKGMKDFYHVDYTVESTEWEAA
jgi:hypothetical protein